MVGYEIFAISLGEGMTKSTFLAMKHPETYKHERLLERAEKGGKHPYQFYEMRNV